MLKRNSLLLNFALFIIIILSFFLNAHCFLTSANSDMAVHVLMSESFRFPEDLYYWGQNRLGSIIPMIGSLFVKIGFKPIIAVSIASYVLLSGAFYFFSKTIKNQLLVIVFALLVFFPSQFFGSYILIGQPYLGQFFFVSIPYFVFYKSISKEWEIDSRKLQIYLPIATCSLGLSLWASELSVVTILIIGGGAAYYIAVKVNKIFAENGSINSLLKLCALSILGLIPALYLLYLAKSTAVGQIYDSNMFVNYKELLVIVNVVFESSWNILTFQENFFLPTIGIYLLLIVSLYLFKFNRKKGTSIFDFKVIGNVALLNVILTFVVVCMSKWVFLNGVAIRYYSPVYIWAIIAIISFCDQTLRPKDYKMYTLLSIGAFFAVIHFIPIQALFTRISHYERLRKFETMGSVSILGGYWDAYLIGMVNPAQIKVLPFDKEFVRNTHQVGEFMKNKTIHIVHSAADTNLFVNDVYQFGYRLQKKGPVFQQVDYYLCAYENLGKLTVRTFQASELASNYAKLVEDHTSGQGKVLSTVGVFDGRQDYLSYGPYSELPAGKYKVKWFIKKEKNADGVIAVVDVCANASQLMIKGKEVKAQEIRNDVYSVVEIDFEVTDTSKQIEFRVLDVGKVPLSISKVEVSVTGE